MTNKCSWYDSLTRYLLRLPRPPLQWVTHNLAPETYIPSHLVCCVKHARSPAGELTDLSNMTLSEHLYARSENWPMPFSTLIIKIGPCCSLLQRLNIKRRQSNGWRWHFSNTILDGQYCNWCSFGSQFQQPGSILPSSAACKEFAHSPYACVGLLRVLILSPRFQRHAVGRLIAHCKLVEVRL